MDKVALCFIISYDHNLNKEHIWKQWIEPNKDIINVYVFYKDYNKIKSPWLKQYAIPSPFILNTSYYFVIPAYISLFNYTCQFKENKWFCLCTESCCPIIPPSKFRKLFFENKQKSIFEWSPCYWNIHLHKRANLLLLPNDFHLANTPWFIFNRENVIDFIDFFIKYKKIYTIVCDGGLANESIFAIALKIYKKLDTVINEKSHLMDWSRMASPTSPHVFKEGNEQDLLFIEKSLRENKYAIFIRKIAPEFPDEILNKYIIDINDDNESKEIKNIKILIYFFLFVGFALGMWYIFTNYIW
jgi:hypothetical protein